MNTQKLKEQLFKIIKNNRKAIAIVGGTLAFIIVVLIAMNASRGNSETLTLRSSSSNSSNNSSANSNASNLAHPIGDGNYDYTEAVDHIGEKATVTGTVQKVFTSKSGTVFFDFCDNFQTCTFSAVIFASDVLKFKDLTQYQRAVKLTGLIKSYQGKAEIILNGPEQIE